MPRIKTRPAWVSLNKFLEVNPSFEWLNTKCQQFALTLSLRYRGDCETFPDNGGDTQFTILDCAERLGFDEEGCSYWWIVHDKDKYTGKDAPSPEDVGKLKPAHVHLVLDFHREVRAYKVLRLVCRFFGSNPRQLENPAEFPDLPVFVSENIEGVEFLGLNPWLNIKPVNNLTPALAYLTHETPEAKEAGKFQYPHMSVISNDPDTFDSAVKLVNQGKSVLTPANLIAIVRACDRKPSRILTLLGLKAYNAYRNIIKDLIVEGM